MSPSKHLERSKTEQLPHPRKRMGVESIRELEEFVWLEARLLDERRFDEWLALYTDDAIYWVPAAPGQSSPFDHVSLFYDDKEALRTRVARLAHPAIHQQTPASRTSHQLSGTCVEWEDGTQYGLRSNFAMHEYRPVDEQRVFAGQCYHTVHRIQGALMIVSKRVDLINCDTLFPAMAVPF